MTSTNPPTPEQASAQTDQISPDGAQPSTDDIVVASGASAELMANSVPEYLRIWVKQIRSGESGALPVIVGLVAIVAALALWSVLDRLLIPGVRWLLRRRINRAIDELNTRLKLRIQPLKLAKRQALIDQLVFDPDVLRAIEEEGMRRRSAEISVAVPESVALYILNQKRTMLAAAHSNTTTSGGTRCQASNSSAAVAMAMSAGSRTALIQTGL